MSSLPWEQTWAKAPPTCPCGASSSSPRVELCHAIQDPNRAWHVAGPQYTSESL